MGRKSKGRSSSLSTSNNNISIREIMRGLKNRWGRFQCPRDGSICKSLEAWHWHRHKYHQTEHINYVELDPNEDDDQTTATPQSTSPSSHPHPPSSPRLLPPEAFAPRRPPEVVFPDDVSDLTEPDIPVLLLSEEVTSREEEAPSSGAPETVFQWEVMDESTSVVDEEEQSGPNRHQHVTMTTTDSRLLPPETASRIHGNDSHGNQELKVTRESRFAQSPSRETNAHRHGNDSHGNDSHGNKRQRHDRSRSHERILEHTVPPPSRCPASSGPTTAPSLSSAMDLVAVYVLRILQRDGSSRPVAKDILREVETRFPGLGLSREGLEGVVAGALMGARDQWTNGYNAGWKDGAKEVLNAPCLRAVPPSPLHSPGGDATSNNCAHNPGQVTLLTLGQRSQDEKEDTLAEKINLSRNSVENIETSAEQTLHHGNDQNNNDAVVMTDN